MRGDGSCATRSSNRSTAAHKSGSGLQRWHAIEWTACRRTVALVSVMRRSKRRDTRRVAVMIEQGTTPSSCVPPRCRVVRRLAPGVQRQPAELGHKRAAIGVLRARAVAPHAPCRHGAGSGSANGVVLVVPHRGNGAADGTRRLSWSQAAVIIQGGTILLLSVGTMNQSTVPFWCR